MQGRKQQPVGLVLALLAGPWTIAWLAYVAVTRALRTRRAIVLGMRDALPCPAGHLTQLVGRWQCRCGFRYLGHAFAPCPGCGGTAGFVPCRCGLSVKSPHA